MDPISASCFSLHIEENARAILEQKRQDEKFNEIIVSCRSLSHYDSRSLKSLWPQILATVVAASFHIVVGIALAFSAILVPQLEDDPSFEITKTQSSWIASIIALVVPVGAISGGFIMDSIGRLNTVKLATIPGVIGWVMIAMASDVPLLIIGRFLTGLAAALGTSPAIVYITEIARADMRGSLIAFAPSYASLGMVLCYLKGWYWGWRVVAWTCIAYTIVPCVLIMLVPESPAWLVSRGRNEQALKSLNWINRYQPQPENKLQSLAEMQLDLLQSEHAKKLEASKHGQGLKSKFRAFLKPTGYKPLAILIGLFFFQQFSGIYITLFYSVSFFEAIGSNMSGYLASILLGSVRLIMSIANTWLLRTFNRRPLIMTSALGMAICMLISGLFTNWNAQKSMDMTSFAWVPVTVLVLYVVTSMVGLLPIPWTMTAELFPLEIRGVAHSVAYSMANLLMFLSVQSYETLKYWFSGVAGVQFFFAAVAIGGLIYTLVFLPETHGKKLTEIADYFEHHTIYLLSRKSAAVAKEKLQKQMKKKKAVKSRVGRQDIVKVKQGALPPRQQDKLLTETA